MIIGIIAEGIADQMVLRNILYAFDVDKQDIIFLRPELREDESDKNQKKELQEEIEDNSRGFGSWTNVKNDCESREPFIDFFENKLVDDKIIIIQLDTDTCSQYGVQEVFNPKKTEDFQEFRQRVITQINNWLENQYADNLLYAICIRQLDAWVLTIYANKGDKDTGFIANPKIKLGSLGAYQSVKSYKKIGERYEILSDDFSNKRKLKKAIEFNQSLKDFIESIEETLKNFNNL